MVLPQRLNLNTLIHFFKSKMLIVGPNQYRIFGADRDIDISEQENSNIRYVGQYSAKICIISAELGFVLFGDKIS